MEKNVAKKPARRPIDWTSPGRMISGTKIAPKGHICVWNANICVKSKGKIWFGDLDLNEDIADLQRLAAEQGERIYILREHDARFLNEAAPLYDKARATIDPDGVMKVHEIKF